MPVFLLSFIAFQDAKLCDDTKSQSPVHANADMLPAGHEGKEEGLEAAAA